MVRFRPGNPFLIPRLWRLANQRNVDLSDVAREGTVSFVESEEKRLGLPPITPAEVARMKQKMQINVALIAEHYVAPDYSLNAAAPGSAAPAPILPSNGPSAD